MIVDLFCGIRGWEILSPVFPLGFDNDPVAVNTCNINGYITYEADVRNISLYDGAKLRGLIASPPCTKVSPAGKKSVISEFPEIIRSVHGDLQELSNDAELLVEPMAWIEKYEPEWVTMEQSPLVLPIWKAYQDVLEERGFYTALGTIDCEQFGLGSVRKRAVFLASKVRPVALPVPDHSKYYPHKPDRFDPEVSKWRSMADTVGWGMTHRPSYTVTAGGTSTGGAEIFGNGARQGMRKEYEAGRWIGPWRTNPSVSDMKKLMSIPDRYKISGTETQQKRQIGNAVPPIVGKKLLECVI